MIKYFLILTILIIKFSFGLEPLIRVLVFDGPINELSKENNRIFVKNNKIFFKDGTAPLSSRGNFSTSEPLIFNKGTFSGEFLFTSKENQIQLINVLALEKYLPGVLAGEISSSWPLEAIKAQAVAARTYALHNYHANEKRPYHVSACTASQVFLGIDKIHPVFTEAVDKTKGVVLIHHGKPANTFFTAACGGMTEKSHEVWNSSEKLSYLQNIRCHYCETHPKFRWKTVVTQKDLIAIVKKKIGEEVIKVHISTKGITGSDRIEKFSLSYLPINKTKTVESFLTGNEFRLLIGGTKMLSTKAAITRIENSNYLIEGVGYGHGVGLCQWGAKTMAENGWGYRAILSYYYKLLSIKTYEYTP